MALVTLPHQCCIAWPDYMHNNALFKERFPDDKVIQIIIAINYNKLFQFFYV